MTTLRDGRQTPGKPVGGGETPSVIETKGLAKTYGQVTALKPLDLGVARGSIFGFLGPNGAGKSTTMKLLLGLARPTSGSGSVFGNDIVSESFQIRRRVGYLAQSPRYYGHMTARETLRFVARFFYSGPESAIERRVDGSLSLVGLSDRADRKVGGFSGGELQRLGIAQAQINDPELLILDEPAASLDPMGRRAVVGGRAGGGAGRGGGSRAAPDGRPGAVARGRARGLVGPDGPPRRAGDHGAAARRAGHHNLLLHAHPRRPPARLGLRRGPAPRPGRA